MNRRDVLRGAISIAAVTAANPTLAGQRMHGSVVAPLVPTVGPAVGWTGTAAAAPSPIARGVAQCMLQCFSPPDQLLVGNATAVFGVDTEALGGVAYVDVSGDVAPTRLFRTIQVDADVNGIVQMREGFFFTLNTPAFTAIANGQLRIIFTATATNGLIAQQVTSILVNVTNAAIAKTYKIRTDGAGGAFTTLKAAAHQRKLDSPASSMFLFDQTGSYELGGLASADNYVAPITGGYVVMAASPGVTATLIRGATFDPNNTAGSTGEVAWEWYPAWGATEFRGSGIVPDFWNWYLVRQQDTHGHWFNGCQLLNSTGARDTTVWNKGPHPQLQVNNFNNNALRSYMTNCVSEYIDIADTMVMQVNCKFFQQITGARGQNTHLIAGCYESQTNAAFFFNAVDGISVTYGGAGTGAILITPSQGGTPTWQLKVNGTTVLTVNMNSKPGQANVATQNAYTLQDVVDIITNFGTNWSAALIDTSNTRACWQLAQVAGTTTVTTATVFAAKVDYHYSVFHSVNTGQSNYIIRNNTFKQCYWTTAPMNCEQPLKDAALINTILDCSSPGQQSAGASGSWSGSHVLMLGCLYDSPYPIYESDIYGMIANNVFPAVQFGNGQAAWPTLELITNNVTIASWPAGGPVSNTTVADTTAYAALFAGKSSGNFSPTGTMPTAAKQTVYDGLYQRRPPIGPIGAWNSGSTPPTEPF